MALLHIKNMTHCFGGLRAVYDFNLTLEGGELMGLIGPNGAGKTTVFQPGVGVLQADGGEDLLREKGDRGTAAPRGDGAGNGADLSEHTALELAERFRQPLHLAAPQAGVRAGAVGPEGRRVPGKREAGPEDGRGVPGDSGPRALRVRVPEKSSLRAPEASRDRAGPWRSGRGCCCFWTSRPRG